MEEKVLFQYRVADDPNAKKSDWIFYAFLIFSLLMLFLGFIVMEEYGPIIPMFGAFLTLFSAFLFY